MGKIYVLIESGGEYEDYSEYPILTSFNKETLEGVRLEKLEQQKRKRLKNRCGYEVIEVDFK